MYVCAVVIRPDAPLCALLPHERLRMAALFGCQHLPLLAPAGVKSSVVASCSLLLVVPQLHEFLDKGRSSAFLPSDFRFDVVVPAEDTHVRGEKLTSKR